MWARDVRHRFTEPTPVDSAVEIVTIRIASWEIECCALPPQVGELSTWQLTAEVHDGQVWGTAHGGRAVTRTVTGTVLSVHLVSEEYREDEQGVWTPVPGSSVLTRVFRSPRWFHGGEAFVSGRSCRAQSGIVIELAVTRDGVVPNVGSAAEVRLPRGSVTVRAPSAGSPGCAVAAGCRRPPRGCPPRRCGRRP
ncbi:DUF6578 domain-containing protein [Rhodococcus olei]|uniref:DUF6578 domain-containing protein n=1 Tax=Rhodococcus olei TaxID=2161675 RepID=UPI003CD09016